MNSVAPILFVALLVQAFLRQGIAVWSIGVAYVLYDTALLAFTAWNIRPLRAGVDADRPRATRRNRGWG